MKEEKIVNLEEFKKILAKPAWTIKDIAIIFGYKDRRKAAKVFHLAQEKGGRLAFDDRRVWKEAVYKVGGYPNFVIPQNENQLTR